MATHLPELGFGLGLRECHHDYVMKHSPDIDWFEVITDNYLDNDGPSKENLLHINQHYPVALHCVSLSIGSIDPLNTTYIHKVRQLAEELDSPMISDHLCWTGVHGRNTHDLLPLPYNKETLNHMAERIKATQDILRRTIVIENPSSYVEFNDSTMPEWQFLAEMAEQAQCGLLLDINNIYVSCFNHSWNAHDYIDSIPGDHIAYMHLAGHTNRETHIIDTHDNHVIDEVWQLYHYTLNKHGFKNTMVEWDDNIPEFPVLEAELDKARAITTTQKAA